jgi:hypothetical protein
METPLHATVIGARRVAARVRNLALGGALLETDAHFAVGESVNLEIHAGTRTIKSAARVRGATPQGISIEFVELKPATRNLLRDLITKLLD